MGRAENHEDTRRGSKLPLLLNFVRHHYYLLFERCFSLGSPSRRAPILHRN